MIQSVTGSEQQLVVFTLSDESYGVDIAKISGIERMHEITKVPRTPNFVQGVINLRGRVIPVVHLRKLFRLPEGEITKETRIVVVDIGGQQIGVQVDEVTEVLTISTEAIEPASSIMTSADSDFMLGIAKLDEKLVILLDLDKVLSNKENAQLSEMNTATTERETSTVEEVTPETAELPAIDETDNTATEEVPLETEETSATFEEEITQELEPEPKPKSKTKKTKRKKTAKASS
jgi:purine-binding chemotaxis protein CheW